MNTIILLLAGLLCVVLVNGRHFEDRHQLENVDEEQFEARKYRERSGEQRHRRKRWQMAYGYDYQPHSYYPDRRNNPNTYDRNEDVLPQIFKLLDDLSDYVKRNQQQPPPPPPQPIYIPYPVPYPVPQYISCKPKIENKPNITQPNRGGFVGMEDVNQNWGFVINDNEDYEDDGKDGARPISFDPIKPKNILMRPPPKVDHGTTQEEVTRTTKVSNIAAETESKSARPGPCNAAILSCCGNSDASKRKECFANMGCETAFSNGGCTPEAINSALNSFKIAYSPIN